MSTTAQRRNVPAAATQLSQFKPLATLAGAALLALTVFSLIHTYHSDDWDILGYVKEVGSTDANLRDPYMGTDSAIHGRAAYNLSTWLYVAAAYLTGLDPVDLYHWVAPPVLIVLSLASVYLMTRQAGLPPNLSATAVLLWVFYFLSSLTGGRSAGTFFFDRIAQDKAMMWLVFCPLMIGLLLRAWTQYESSTSLPRVGWQEVIHQPFAGPTRDYRATLGLFAVCALAAVFIHPLGCVFAAVLATAVLLAVVLRDRSVGTSFLVPSVAAVLPSVVVGGLLALATPAGGGGERVFKTEGPDFDLIGVAYEPLGARDIVDFGPTFVVDPSFISPLNFAALLWILWSLMYGRRTLLTLLSASIYGLVAVAAYLPGVPELLSRLITTVGVWRMTWLIALAWMLAAADFLVWLTQGASLSRTRSRALLVGLSVAALVPLFMSWSHVSRAAGSGGPNAGEAVVLQQLDAMTSRHSDVVILAANDLSTFIPAYTSEASVVFYPSLGQPDDAPMEGSITRRRANLSVETARTYGQLIDAMAAWNASLVVLERHARLFDREPPRELETCFSTNTAVILARKDKGGCR